MTRPISLVKALSGVPGFDAVPERELLRIVGSSVNLFWPQGRTVFEQGSSADALYVVLTGCVQVLDGEAEVGQVEAGDFFGEMSLLADTTHSKSVRALEDTELLVLPKEAFAELIESQPGLASVVRARLQQRRRRDELATEQQV